MPFGFFWALGCLLLVPALRRPRALRAWAAALSVFLPRLAGCVALAAGLLYLRDARGLISLLWCGPYALALALGAAGLVRSSEMYGVPRRRVCRSVWQHGWSVLIITGVLEIWFIYLVLEPRR